MARVFISYRRADGQYAVGWIEEVLRRLETVADVRTAFRDSDLRHGDDFPAQLAGEVEQCDVLIAVIGPNWRGEQPDGSARILDPIDWVGREIDSALKLRKRIIPVLLAGVEPLQSSDLLHEHRELANLHALRFDERAALGLLVEDVKSHLEDIDAERAKTSGLDEPITVESMSFSKRVVALACAAGLVGLGLGYAIARFPPEPEWNKLWVMWSSVQLGAWSILAVLGVAHHRNVLHDITSVRWRSVRNAAGLAAVLISLAVIAFGPGDNNRVARTFVQAPLAVVLMAPWILMLLGPQWMRTTATTPGGRAHAIAAQRRAVRQSTPPIALGVVLGMAATASLTNPNGFDPGVALSLLGFGVFLTLIIGAAVNVSSSALQHESEMVALEVVDLGTPYRQHAEDVLVTDRRDLWTWALGWSLVPIAFAMAAIAIGIRW